MTTAKATTTSALATTTTLPKAPQPLELVEAGYTVTSGSPYVEYGVIIRNPNRDYGAGLPTVRITMRDANGRCSRNGRASPHANHARRNTGLGWAG